MYITSTELTKVVGLKEETEMKDSNVMRRLALRMPDDAMSDLNGIRGMFAAAKLTREDSYPVSQEQAVAICIKYAYQRLSQMQVHDFKEFISPMARDVMRHYEGNI